MKEYLKAMISYDITNADTVSFESFEQKRD